VSTIINSSIQGVFQEINIEIQTNFTRYNQTYQAFSEAGGLDPASLNSKNDFASRRKLLSEFGEANEALDAVYRDSEDELMSKLMVLGVSSDQILVAIKNWNQENKTKLIRDIRNTDRLLVKAYGNYLDILEDQLGQWALDPETGQIFVRK
jgi:hypothetical protein